MILKELTCPGCGAPLKAKVRDMLLDCGHCGNVLQFADGEVVPVAYMIAAPVQQQSNAELLYVPFWIIRAELDVSHEDISGGGIRRFISGQKQMRGVRDFYVCAADMPERDSRVWNMDLTLTQPEFADAGVFRDGTKVVTVMDRDTAIENAEFLFLRYETELPGTLQELEYTFHVQGSRILFIPVWKRSTAYTLGV